ncbi:NADH:flavin oxidoreductase/NADH oxidase [Flavobacterium sp. P21]|uniref:NADH:flavin oxidoreductase/NADH oxidase n=1 Tax=Flavobacterium sp. P21 TaxID=3423948 RepID=UPI003D66FD93
MTKLFSPLTIKGVTLKNRIVVSPMCQYSSVDGFATDWHFVHLGSRAVGGAALILTEATAVSPEGRISPHDLGIWKDEHIEKLLQITSFLKQQGSVTGIQLAHSGRKGSTMVPWEGHSAISIENGGWHPLAPSAITYSENYPMPVELDKYGIKKVIEDFKSVANRAIKAGFQVIEIHAGHGYLSHQFLSPLTNHRTDNYGGSLNNRMRLVLEILEVIKKTVPAEIPIFVRIPGTDWVEGGWTSDDAIALSATLKDHGADAVDVTTAGLSHDQKIPVGPAYQLPFASKIKKTIGIITATVGLITNAVQAESILVNEDADLIFMAREFLRDPYFPLTASN